MKTLKIYLIIFLTIASAGAISYQLISVFIFKKKNADLILNNSLTPTEKLSIFLENHLKYLRIQEKSASNDPAKSYDAYYQTGLTNFLLKNYVISQVYFQKAAAILNNDLTISKRYTDANSLNLFLALTHIYTSEFKQLFSGCYSEDEYLNIVNKIDDKELIEIQKLLIRYLSTDKNGAYAQKNLAIVNYYLNRTKKDLTPYPEAFILYETKIDAGAHFNKTAEINLNTAHNSGDILVEDFNQDGLQDIFLTHTGTLNPVQYYQQEKDSRFIDSTDKIGIKKMAGGEELIPIDFNDDKYVDLFIIRGSWQGEFGLLPNTLFKNTMNKTLTDITAETGLDKYNYPTSSVAWADFDHDNDLDFFSANQSNTNIMDVLFPDTPASINKKITFYPSELFENNNNTAFKDVSLKKGVAVTQSINNSYWGDYNSDGLLDLLISVGANELQLFIQNTNNQGFRKASSDEIAAINFKKSFGYIDLPNKNHDFFSNNFKNKIITQDINQNGSKDVIIMPSGRWWNEHCGYFFIH